MVRLYVKKSSVIWVRLIFVGFSIPFLIDLYEAFTTGVTILHRTGRVSFSDEPMGFFAELSYDLVLALSLLYFGTIGTRSSDEDKSDDDQNIELR